MGRDVTSPKSGVFLDVYEAQYPAAIQVSIGNDRHGYRLAGPKFSGSGSRLLRRIRLSERDAREIASYLAEVKDD